MDPNKLPSKEAKSLSFLVYSLFCLVSASLSNDPLTKKVFWVFASLAFLLAAFKFAKDSIKLPLWPCKNRCNDEPGVVCIRDKGFYCGIAISVIAASFIKYNNIIFPLDQTSSLVIAIFCVLSTVVHGTLRRYFGFVSSGDRLDQALTFLTGFVTGLGIFFAAICFI